MKTIRNYDGFSGVITSHALERRAEADLRKGYLKMVDWLNIAPSRYKNIPSGRPKTTSVMRFLDFYGKSDKREIEKIERVELEGFIEHEQDRELRITTVRTRLARIIAFLHFLIEQEVIPGSVLKRGIKLKLPKKGAEESGSKH